MPKASPVAHNAVIAKHNTLIPQLAKLELSELRLLNFCLAHYDPRKGEPETYEIQKNKEFKATVKDLLEIFPYMGHKSAYDVVKQAVMSINRKPFYELRTYDNGTEEDVYMFWFSEFRYLRHSGEFTFCISPKIVDRILSLDKNFTMFRLKDVYQFKSATTWKMYEILKQWVRVGKWFVALDELKFLLGIAGKYPRWDSLKSRVIETSLKEINKLSDIFVEYTLTKRVRTITGVEFFIKAQNQKEILNYTETLESEENPNIKLLINAGLNQINAINLCDLAIKANKDIKHFFDKINSRYENKTKEECQKYKGKEAYLYKALYNEFQPLLNNLESTEKEKAALKKQTDENNKYGIEAIKCIKFDARTDENKCTDEKPNTKKCKACTKIKAINYEW